jgi:hypothetical protein
LAENSNLQASASPPGPSGGSKYRRLWKALAVVVAAAIAVTGTVILLARTHNRGQPPTVAVGSPTPAGAGPISGAKSPLPQIVFTSDQSVILGGRNSTYQFVAHVETASHKALPETLRWVSSNPALVTISSTGQATVNADFGSTIIYVDAAGAQEQVAQVAIAAPGANTVLVPSADVVSVGRKTAILKQDPQLGTVTPGAILVSGDRGGLLAKVVTVSRGFAIITVNTAPATLLEAFPKLSIRAESAPAVLALSYSRDQSARLLSEVTAASPSAPPSASPSASPSPSPSPSPSTSPSPTPKACTRNKSGSVSTTLTGPSVSVPVTANLIGVLDWTGQSVRFALAVQARVPIIITTGAVLMSAAGSIDVTCDWELGALDLPTPIFFGPIRVDGIASLKATIDLVGNVAGQLSLNGPSVSAIAALYDGIQYTNTGGWTTIHNNGQTGVHVSPVASSFNASLSVDFTPAVRLDLGVAFELGPINTAQADFVFGKAAGSIHFEIATPLDSMQSGYTGPLWSAGFELAAGPEIALAGGALTTVLNWIGLTPPNIAWDLVDLKFPLAGSPQINVSVAGASAPGGKATFAAAFPDGYDKHTVTFILYPKVGGAASVVGKTSVSGKSATTQYTVPDSGLAPYEVAVLLEACPCGSVLPYVSGTNPPASPVGSGNAPTASSAFNGWTLPVNIDANGGGLTWISCPTATFCAAVDSVGNVLTYDGNIWSQPNPVDPGGGGLYSVSCPTPSFCVAGDARGDVVTYDGAVWTAPQNVASVGFEVHSIDCQSPTFCVAVTFDGSQAVFYDGQSWRQFQGFSDPTTKSDAGAWVVAVDCSTASDCIEVDGAGNVNHYSAGAWSQPQAIDSGGGGLDAVSCPTSSFCATLDFAGAALLYSGGKWSLPANVDAFGVGYGSFFSGNGRYEPSGILVDCLSASFCIAVDIGGNALTYDGNSWSSPAPVPGESAGFTGISCATASFCMAVDETGDALSFSSP